jgi:hypothetical protein
MKQYLGVFILLSTFALTGCNSSKKEKQQQPTETKELVGNDVDAHGCRGSAGYMWSAMQKKCIRPFNLPIKMISVGDDTNKRGAFAQFNADSTKVELFASPWSKGVILERREVGEGFVWDAKEKNTPLLKQEAGVWSLSLGDKLIYQGKKK